MIRDVLKKATKGAITWVGTKFGIPAPITAGATDIAESLFTKLCTNISTICYVRFFWNEYLF